MVKMPVVSGVLMLIMAALLTSSPGVMAQTSPPMNVYGIAHVDGVAVADADVDVYVNGVYEDSVITNTTGWYNVDLTGTNGNQVSFVINGKSATPKLDYESGKSVRHDLYAGTTPSGVKTPGGYMDLNEIPGPGIVGVLAGALVAAVAVEGGRVLRNKR